MTPQTISILIALGGFLFGLYQYLKKSTKDDSTVSTQIIMKLENIQQSVSDIKTDVGVLKEDTRADRERIIRLEESIKKFEGTMNTMWSRIDTLKEIKSMRDDMRSKSADEDKG